MNKLIKNVMLLSALSGMLVLSSCKKDTPALPDNLVAFDSDQLGMSESEDELTISLSITSAISTPSNVIVTLSSNDVVYGTHYTTDPAAISNQVVVTVPANATTASFKISKVDGALFAGTEQLTFTITSADNSLKLGDKSVLTLTFAEIVATSGSIELNGGGSLYPNKVFVDLSGSRQTAIARTTWDLGFSTGDNFRVILNSSNGMMARVLDKTDLATVTAADTVGWGAQLSIEAVFAAITSEDVPEWTADAFNWIDDPSGDLSKTAIGATSATALENHVYIVNRGDGPGTPGTKLGWKKIRIIRNGNGYTLQHADIASANFTEVQITKDAIPEGEPAAFNYISFATGAVEVEPARTKWDIAWTGFANLTDFGSGPVPYYFQDIVLQNTSGVEVAQVLNSGGVTYEAFAESNLAAQTYSTSQIKIGSSWRSGGGPTTAPSLRTDRYYIVHDADGNYYKLRFTALTTNGERGKPAIEFALVKKGS